jgi:hypothetical protein
VDSTVDWKNASTGVPWTTPGGDYASEKIQEITVNGNEFGWVSFNVLTAVKDFIANPDKNFGFLLRNSAFAQEIDIATSKFYANADYRPKMVFEYPASQSGLTQKQAGSKRGHNPVALTTVNRKLHIANTGITPVRITLCGLDGTTVASEMLSGGMRKTLSASSGGVYLISVSGNNFTVNGKVSLFH